MRVMNLHHPVPPASASVARSTRRNFLGTGAVLACSPLFAQELYPSRRLEIVVPFPSGGTADFLARIIGQKLSEAWKQQVIIVNKPGGGGSIGADYLMQAPADGHTLLLTSYVNRKVLFTPTPPVSDPARDPVPTVLLTKPPLVLLAHPSLPVKSARELIELARQRPDINYASIGSGTPSHLAMELLKRSAGFELTHVPYKGSSQALSDVVAGHVPLMFDSVVSSSGHVKAGRLRALAVSSATRLSKLAEVPTITESGVPGFDVSTWAVMYAPAGTPADRLVKIQDAVNQVMRHPEVVERLTEQGASIPPPMSTAQVAAFIRNDVAMWRKLVMEAGIQAD